MLTVLTELAVTDVDVETLTLVVVIKQGDGADGADGADRAGSDRRGRGGADACGGGGGDGRWRLVTGGDGADSADRADCGRRGGRDALTAHVVGVSVSGSRPTAREPR